MGNETKMIAVPLELLQRVVDDENTFPEHRRAHADLVEFLDSIYSKDIRKKMKKPNTNAQRPNIEMIK